MVGTISSELSIGFDFWGNVRLKRPHYDILAALLTAPGLIKHAE